MSLGYSRLKEEDFPFDLKIKELGGEMMKMYECKGCGFTRKYDPRKVPEQCPECNALYPFMRCEQAA